MLCNACGLQVSQDSAFCGRCKMPLLKDQSATTTRSTASQRALAGQVCSVVGRATRQFLPAGPEVWLAAPVFLLLLLENISCSTSTHQQPTAQQSSPQPGNTSDSVVAVIKPTILPPKFRIYRLKLNEGISVVVSPSTTDEQLKSLLWLFREKVRSHRFKDIGINQPTSTEWGKKGKKDYSSGTISVYRGDKCAGEDFLDVVGAGPCGQGGHEAAYYQWGFRVDDVFQADADHGEIASSGGDYTRVFNYKDHWQAPAELQTGLDAEKKAQ